MQQPQAFIFDLNGTMIDDMHYHEQAWFDVLNSDLQAHMNMAQVRSHMYGKNEELFARVFGERFTEEEARQWSYKKELLYQKNFLPHLKLISGLDAFLKKAKAQNLLLVIGTAANKFNLSFVIDNLRIRQFFDAIVSAEEVLHGKPDPEVFVKCAEKFGVNPERCVVFEDTPNGAKAAAAAGMQSVIIKTYHSENEFAGISGILFFIDDYTDSRLCTLL